MWILMLQNSNWTWSTNILPKKNIQLEKNLKSISRIYETWFRSSTSKRLHPTSSMLTTLSKSSRECHRMKHLSQKEKCANGSSVTWNFFSSFRPSRHPMKEDATHRSRRFKVSMSFNQQHIFMVKFHTTSSSSHRSSP